MLCPSNHTCFIPYSSTFWPSRLRQLSLWRLPLPPRLSHTLRHRHRPLLCQLLKCLFLVVLHDSSLLEICDLHPTTNRLALSSPQTQIYQSSSPSHPPPPSPTPERNTHPTSSTFLLQALALSPTRLLRRVLLPYAVDDTVGFETGKEIVARSPAVGA